VDTITITKARGLVVGGVIQVDGVVVPPLPLYRRFLNWLLRRPRVDDINGRYFITTTNDPDL
jgi:hypothetical protein